MSIFEEFSALTKDTSGRLAYLITGAMDGDLEQDWGTVTQNI